MGKFSFTMDIWTDDYKKKAYMAVTAHWLEKVTLSGRLQSRISLRTDLIGFMHVSGSHTGERLAEAFLLIIGRLRIARKVYIFYIDRI